MRDFFTGKKIKIIAAVCLVLIGSMIYSLSRGGEASYLESFFGALTTPFQKANAAIVNGLSDFFVKLGDYDRLKEENDMLRQEIRADGVRDDEIRNKTFPQEDGVYREGRGQRLTNHADTLHEEGIQFQAALFITERTPGENLGVFCRRQGFHRYISPFGWIG